MLEHSRLSSLEWPDQLCKNQRPQHWYTWPSIASHKQPRCPRFHLQPPQTYYSTETATRCHCNKRWLYIRSKVREKNTLHCDTICETCLDHMTSSYITHDYLRKYGGLYLAAVPTSPWEVCKRLDIINKLKSSGGGSRHWIREHESLDIFFSNIPRGSLDLLSFFC